MRQFVFFTAVFLGWACGLGAADEALKVPRNPITDEDRKFAKEFATLLKKHPKAADRFYLADFGVSRTVASFVPHIYECDRFEIPGFGPWVECHAEEPQ